MKKKMAHKITIGLGDNLVIRVFFDSVKDQFSEIRIAHDKQIIKFYRNNDPVYCRFLEQLGKLLFSEPPYVFDHGNHPEINTYQTMSNLGTPIKNPDLAHLLCKGNSLNLGEPYIVILTKVRVLSKNVLFPLLPSFWQTIRDLSRKYKIVILGEKVTELSKEYVNNQNTIYSIYEQIISNVPRERLLDLTVPALGVTSPTLDKIQQDCLIMKEAEAVVTFGIGGNFWMSMASANQTIGFRADDDRTTDLIDNPHYKTAKVTKNWSKFINDLRNYL